MNCLEQLANYIRVRENRHLKTKTKNKSSIYYSATFDVSHDSSGF